jgi:hypothetical protein
MLSESGRIQQSDKKFEADVLDGNFANQLFLRLVAKDNHRADRLHNVER